MTNAPVQQGSAAAGGPDPVDDPVRTGGKYARTERERRFLLAEAPMSLAQHPAQVIDDWYVDRTRLRLRTVSRDGRDTVFKLGQKIRRDPREPSTVDHTTLYLDRSEYELLRALPGRRLEKARTVLAWESLTVAVDVFAGRLRGLVLAEVDLGDRGVLPAPPLLRWVAEVTDDDRFTGGALAGTDQAGLSELLSAHDLPSRTGPSSGAAEPR